MKQKSEVVVEITSRRVAVLLSALLLFPLLAWTGERIAATQRISSPGAIFRSLVVTGDQRAGGTRTRLAVTGGNVIMTTSGNNGGWVDLGPAATTTPPYRMRVAGNVQVTGCIILSGSKRCSWVD